MTRRPISTERRRARLARARAAVAAVAAAAGLAACSPATTRPDFLPFPEDRVLVLAGEPADVTTAAARWLTSEGLQIEWQNAQDGYLETAWYDTHTRRSTPGTAVGVGDVLSTVKIRCWVDPDAPGKAKLTVEAVYRPMIDPSRTERDQEQVVPGGSDGAVLVGRLIDALTQKFKG